jgi:Concanavalin A-like lectin/glucanases superfamily/Glycine rich protein
MYKFLSLFVLLILSISGQAQKVFPSLALRKPVGINTQIFSYTGFLQPFIVPNRVTSIQVNAIGAKGGTGARGQVGGAGANITTTLNVTPGQVLYIVVGGFPGQSATAKYGYGGNGGSGTNYGGAGGGLSGVFTSSSPAVANALIVAGGGGGGSGNATGTNFTGGNAGNNLSGNSSNGNEENPAPYVVNGRSQFGYAASNSSAGLGGEPYDVVAGTRGSSGNEINGGNGGTDGGVGSWNGAGGGGAGFYGGGGGAGGGAACGGGAGGATKSSSSNNSYGALNNTGDGSVSITCFSNSGLVLHLDAGNPNSYSGSGTAWNDLSGNGSNVTLTSTTYNSANGGSIVFNGTTSYADFTANVGSTNVVTVEMWVKTNSLTNPTGMYFGFGLYDAWTSGGNIGYNTSAGDLYGVPSAQVDNLGIVGGWRHLVFVMYTGSKTNNKIYVNGEAQIMSQVYGTFNSANSNFNSGNGRISSWRNDFNWRMNMNVANFKVYNKELTSQEITNNFNANKSRFYAEKDGLSPGTASSSAYQIKQDYPSSTDGFYWIKNANINGGAPFRIYADMTTSGGGWTMILKNSSNSVWTYANTIAYNREIPFTSTSEVNSTSTASYSIIGWADYIKRSASGFEYMIDAGTRGRHGGIWTANGAYSFVKTDNSQTDVTVTTKFDDWNYNTANNGISQRMPWYTSTTGSGTGYLTLSTGSGNWWGTMVSNNQYYTPSPWLSDASGGTASSPNPGIIWYWVR